MKLSATMICREAIMHLRNEIRHPTPQILPYPPMFTMKEPREGIFYANVALSDDSLDLSLEQFSRRLIWPSIRRLRDEVRKIDLGDEFMELPKGVADAANERFDGLAMRVVIDDKCPWKGEPGIWRRVVEYYDIATDAFKIGPCGICCSFTVHKPGAATYIPTVNFEEKAP